MKIGYVHSTLIEMHLRIYNRLNQQSKANEVTLPYFIQRIWLYFYLEVLFKFIFRVVDYIGHI